MDWPGLVRPLVARFGPAEVWRTAWALLDYPPTWITQGIEFLTLKESLERR